MKLYEQFLFERSQIITKNASSPCAAYEAVHGKVCPHRKFGPGRGRYPGAHSTKTWNGMNVDGHLKDQWLRDLNMISQIELRSVCEGHDSDWLTHVAFRFRDPKYNMRAATIQRKLEGDGVTKTASGIGKEGRLRVLVAANLWYGQPGWEKWWAALPGRLKSAVM